MGGQYQNRSMSAKGKDGTFPSSKSGAVTRKTGGAGHAMTNIGGNKSPRASRAEDGTPMEDGHMQDSMTGGGGGPKHGPAFHKKYDVSAMSQAIRGRAKSGY